VSGPAAPPRVAVLIVSRNRKADLLETLAALETLEYPPDRLHVLVLDNGSDDETAAAVRVWQQAGGGRRLGALQCFRSPENVGASAARNVLAEHAPATADLFFILDDDAVPDATFLTRALASLGPDPTIGIVGGRIVAFDDPTRELAGAGFIDWRLGRFQEVAATATRACDFVITCAMVVRPQAFQAAGGFDEDYFVYHEDVDFCVRVGRRGFRVLYEPAAVARHKVPPGKTRSPERLYYVLRNKFLFLRKHLPPRRHPLAWAAYGTALIPAMIVQSLVINRGLLATEVRTILAAGRDGWRGTTGRWRR
jgi:GT2 family glycosyltransferase